VCVFVCVQPEALCFQVVSPSGRACVLNGEFLAVDLRVPIYEIAYDSSYLRSSYDSNLLCAKISQRIIIS